MQSHRVNSKISGRSPPLYCLKKNLNAPRPSEHPPVRGENVDSHIQRIALATELKKLR